MFDPAGCHPVTRHMLIICCVGASVFCGFLGGCTDESDPDQRELAMPELSIEEVLDAYTDSLMAIPGVVGVGQGQCDGAPCIRVLAAEMTSEIEENVPDTLKGYPVDIEVTGPVRKRSPN